ncbi:hypothetical protein V6N12_060180 [Hibiscus sabdariffa]|uniref:Uncharacterized protein n=1 Tax=Hibiscus sabdariffa TaxID=183260 RepID=A0ABR2D3N7_9ROSI
MWVQMGYETRLIFGELECSMKGLMRMMKVESCRDDESSMGLVFWASKGFSYWLYLIMKLGMGSALETLCGQAFGAGQLDMLGIYMQRSWVIVITTALILTLPYIFASPVLRLIGQTESISKAAGIFSIWMIPELFAYAFNFTMAKFLQAQSKMVAMALISGVALVLHVVLSWLLMLKLGWGLMGAAIVLNMSWIFIDVGQFLYIISGTCGRAWTGFSWKAFQNLWGFVRLSLASAIMICLEIWYFMALILFAGYLKDAEVSVGALAIWNVGKLEAAGGLGVVENGH